VSDARTLLDRILKEEPTNVSAHETMGFLAFREGKIDEAEKWYEQAVKLDSQSFLAHYYFAAMAMQEGKETELGDQLEASLRAATKLNPAFAPAFDQLAVFYGQQHKNLDDAAMLNLVAVQLDPANVHYRMNRANLMMEMNRQKDAIAVLQTALKIAKPEEKQMVEGTLESIQRFETAMENRKREYETEKAQAAADAEVIETADAIKPEEADNAPLGPKKVAKGKLENVQCSYPAVMKLKVENGTKSLELLARNYYKVQFSALNFKPSADLNPCKDLEGLTGKVEYYEAASAGKEGQIISIELSK
jgi:predicted Zn-dependent protease